MFDFRLIGAGPADGRRYRRLRLALFLRPHVERRLVLPHVGFHRKIGVFAGHHVSPEGAVLDAEAWHRGSARWLPTDSDHEYVTSLMGRVVAPGQFAGWIAPPARGVNNQPIDFEYVRFN